MSNTDTDNAPGGIVLDLHVTGADPGQLHVTIGGTPIMTGTLQSMAETVIANGGKDEVQAWMTKFMEATAAMIERANELMEPEETDDNQD